MNSEMTLKLLKNFSQEGHCFAKIAYIKHEGKKRIRMLKYTIVERRIRG